MPVQYATNISLLRGRCNRPYRQLQTSLGQIFNAGPSECSRPSCLAVSTA